MAIEKGQGSGNLNARVLGYDLLFVFPQFYVALFLFVSVVLSCRFSSCVIPVSLSLFSCFGRYLLSVHVMFKLCVYASSVVSLVSVFLFQYICLSVSIVISCLVLLQIVIYHAML